MEDCSSQPHRQLWRSGSDLQAWIRDARVRTNLGPVRLSHIVGAALSTMWKLPIRHGHSPAAYLPRAVTTQYEWAEAGALVQIDIAKLARFDGPGHRTLEHHRTDAQK